MVTLVRLVLGTLRHLFDSRGDLALENLALRQQLAMFATNRPKPRPTNADRAFWVALRDHLASWADVLVVVKPSTVTRWHRQGFRYYWRWRSRKRTHGRPPLALETRQLIRTMALDNRWRAPRIARELGRLGIDLHPDTVRRYMPKLPPSASQSQSWRTFLANHRDAIAAMDFFVVPTATFRLLYGLVVIHHGRRAVLHINATFHPTASWVIQQLREAFPFDARPRYLIFDRDSIFNGAVVDAIASFGIEPTRTAYRCPWQNPVCERWIGTLRRECLDHVIVFGDAHFCRLSRAYVAYYNTDRCHTTLDDDSPEGRPVETRTLPSASVVALARCGGLHHRYAWRDAA